MSVEAIVWGIGAILTLAGGVSLVVREIRHRDRKSMRHLLDDSERELVAAQTRIVSYRRWGFFLAERLASHGEPVPPPPNGDDE